MSILINDVAPRKHYIATATQTEFVVPFEWLANADLKVYVNGILQTFQDPPTIASTYKTTGLGLEGGGSITFGLPGRLAGDEVIIFRDMVIDSPADFPATGIFPVSTINLAFDELVAGVQETDLTVSRRALIMDKNDFQEWMNPIPHRPARRGKLLGFDHDGHPVATDGSTLGGGDRTARCWTDDTPPPLPWVDGDLWWNSTNGLMYVWYDDVDSPQWVQVNYGMPPGVNSYAVPHLPPVSGAVVSSVGHELEGRVSVYSFGVTGDGVTDDTDALNIALASGQTLYVPPGNYLVGGNLIIAGNTRLVGAGANRSLFIRKAGSTGTLFTAISVNNIIIGDIGVLGNFINNPSAGSAFIFDNVSNSEIRNCRIADTTQDGIRFSTGGQNNRIIYNSMEKIGSNGIRVNGLNNVQIIGNLILDAGWNPYWAPASGGIGISVANASSIQVHNNQCLRSSNNGLDIWNTNGLIATGNILSNSVARSGIGPDGGSGAEGLQNQNILLLNNICRDNNQYGIVLANSCSFMLTAYNNLRGNGQVVGYKDFSTSGSNRRVYKNFGYVTENSGNITIDNAATSAVVTHLLNLTPDRSKIQITPRTDWGATTKYWVSAADATTFTVMVSPAPGPGVSSIILGWSYSE